MDERDGRADTPPTGRGPGARLREAWRRSAAWLGRHTPTRRQVAVGALGVALTVALLWHRCGISGCPNVARLNSYQPGHASILLDRSGRPFADLAPVRHEVVPLDSLPAYVPAAFVAVEDKRFYRHHGVDWRRVVGAALADLKAGAFVQGFSTITMQLARNVWHDRLPGEQRTLKRKILEVRVARDIERHYTKKQILGLYLNQIYFGEGAYGIEAAARNYFGRHARDLTLAQAATLAAIPKSPVIYNPRRRPRRARARRDLVLALMAEQGWIAPAAAARARQLALGVRREPPAPERERPGVAPYFVDEVRRVLEDRLGDDIYAAPLKVYTTLDLSVQQAAERELERQIRSIEDGAFGRFPGERCRPGSRTADDTIPANCLEGAAVVMSVSTGDVLALVGGRDYERSSFDRATRAWRQPGSAFKPFVYAAALAAGYAPSQHILDTPFRMRLPGGEVWAPRNFTGTFEGEVTLREALVRSINVPTIRLAAAVGMDEVARTAHRAGIGSPIPGLPSAAIGSAAVTPLELTAAYTAFAGLGRAVEPRFVLRVEDADGDRVWAPDVDAHRALSPAVAYVITDMLADAVDEGTGKRVREVGMTGPVAGKTGTTNDGTDVWFAGYTPELAATVWIGFDTPRPIVEDASGGELAAPVWGRILRRVYRNRRLPHEWARPADVVRAPVDPRTGRILAPGCRPEVGAPATELFIRGMTPAESCPRGGAAEERAGPLARALEWLHGGLRSMRRWIAEHFGREEPPTAPRTRDRYLGAPRLPAADAPALPIPEPPDTFRIPDFEEKPVVPPVRPESLPPVRPESLPRGPLDSLRRVPPESLPPARPDSPPPGRPMPARPVPPAVPETAPSQPHLQFQ
ncbi:MAG: PBP1A family penicillin-binding protein [Gemmatimonadetes bacterium]|nr:PBP1A family penicillin-binding protein [Gemmatimonadota bacterium]